MRRFTDTAKWDDPWFRGLSGPHKLVFLYVIDRCNNAGFWEYDEDAVIFHTRLKQETVEGACKALARGLKGAGGWVWVKNFLKHQKNDELKPENPAHRQIISLLRDQLDRFSEVPEFQSFVAPYMGLVRPIGIGKGKGIPEEEVQEKKPAKSRGTQEEFEAYAVERGFPASDGTGTYDHFISNGWMLGKAPVKDWKAAFRTRAQNGWLPSQQNKSRPQEPRPTPTPKLRIV